MNRLFLGNFDFEHHLGTNSVVAQPKQIRQLQAELAHALIPLMQAGDVLWTPEPYEANYLNILRDQIPGLPEIQCSHDQIPHQCQSLQPWGWSESVLLFANKHGLSCEHPDLSIIEKVNSRVTSFEYEQNLDINLPGSCVIEAQTQLEHKLSQIEQDERWVMKSEFGMSARERILGQGCDVSKSNHGWLSNQLSRGRRLVWEPWVEKISESSLHYDISPDGNVTSIGTTLLITDSQGRYLGNMMKIDNELNFGTNNESKETHRFAQFAAELGYFGPLSIDIMRYRDDSGEEKSRSLMDINARYSMGRCALEWATLMNPHRLANGIAWIHRSPEEIQAHLDESLRWQDDDLELEPINAMQTSSESTGGEPTRCQTHLVQYRWNR